MDSSIIILDSSDDEQDIKVKKAKFTIEKTVSQERGIPSGNPIREIQKIKKRITPKKIADKVSVLSKMKYFGDPDEDDDDVKFKKETLSFCMDNISTRSCSLDHNQENSNNDVSDASTSNTATTNVKDNTDERTPINTNFQELIEACRNADSSPDMELLINRKLIRYYESVHPDFVNSKSFCKTVQNVAQDININPDLVYLKISSVLEELNTRRKIKDIVLTNEEITSTGSERKDAQIRKLNKALYILKKRIAMLEEAEVDFTDDYNSAHMQAERYKKRACEIYEKICDITGESKHAQRSVRKPIRFQGTAYPEFNKTIQTFVNRTNTFPDFIDVYKCLEHCNAQYSFKLKSDEMKKIAQDAFIKVGKLLQTRRKADLYETVSYFVGTEKDPALVDKELQEKLLENKKHYSKISDLINKYAIEQETKTEHKHHSITTTKTMATTTSTIISTSSSTARTTRIVIENKKQEIDCNGNSDEILGNDNNDNNGSKINDDTNDDVIICSGADDVEEIENNDIKSLIFEPIELHPSLLVAQTSISPQDFDFEDMPSLLLSDDDLTSEL